jgi:cation transport protein ChaC
MNGDDLWVFGYGSLMWEPGFPVAEKVIARLDGYHRSFCMRSIHHRGTERDPGLVLALDAAADAACHGIAFRAEPGTEAETIAYLRERELVSAAYLEERHVVQSTDGRAIETTCFVIDRAHDQYCGGLPLEEQARIIAHAVGGRGPNWEYLVNTARHLQELDLRDPDLDWLSERVAALRAL